MRVLIGHDTEAPPLFVAVRTLTLEATAGCFPPEHFYQNQCFLGRVVSFLYYFLSIHTNALHRGFAALIVLRGPVGLDEA
jgi:hypothetical protein